jgi:hypothetical protein
MRNPNGYFRDFRNSGTRQKRKTNERCPPPQVSLEADLVQVRPS